MAGILILPPLITNLVNETTGFLIVCVISIIIGIVESISQSNLIGLIATLPSKYSKYLMVGNGLSGVIISSSRLFCLGVFPLDNSGYFYSTLLYFAICAAILSICVGIQGHIMKHPLVFEGLRKTHAKESRKTAVSEGSTCEYSLDLKVKTKKPADIAKLMNEIWHYMLLIWINYVITFGMLSHVSLATSSE